MSLLTETADCLLKSSSNKLETQVPIIIENENSDSSHLPSINIENSNKIFTNDTTNQSSNANENLFDFCKKIYDHTVAIFQKQEKTTNQMQLQIKQTKFVIVKLECVKEKI
ncbi:hypothetical protein C1646_762257 [Rhizophagus diaphanus]|nr:hypothetical protein C1646_762257 [Rhizophagus diaphanus] [Rhizophagus sp. MUCL 43196]